MPTVCFYFQVHQPNRLKKYMHTDIGTEHDYEDQELNRQVLDKVSDRCYIPTNKLMLELIKKHKKKFKISYSISGVALEQMEAWRPDVIKSFVELSKTGCVEFLSETFSHSISYLYSKEEFKRQVELHASKIKKLFNQTPVVFRNTELIYNNELAKYAEDMGFKGIICEGVDWILNGRSPNFLYRAPNVTTIKSLLKNYRLSDDIAFRFSDKNWSEHPLSAQKFAGWMHSIAGSGEVINLFMDYETFGEHQWEESGIFDFLKQLPEEILKHKDFDFLTPSEVVEKYEVKGIYDAHNPNSWADTERDLSAWLSNNMQLETMAKIYSFEKDVKSLNDTELLAKWSRLLTSDHFYYMCTKYWADGDVHKYFSPYDSPYEAYMYYVNAIADFEIELKKALTSKSKTVIEEVIKPTVSKIDAVAETIEKKIIPAAEVKVKEAVKVASEEVKKVVNAVKEAIQHAAPAKKAEPVKVAAPVKKAEPVKVSAPAIKTATIKKETPVKVAAPAKANTPVKKAEPSKTTASPVKRAAKSKSPAKKAATKTAAKKK